MHICKLTVAVTPMLAALAMKAHGQTLIPLYSFSGGPDGGNPVAGLATDGNGHLYGTTPLLSGLFKCNNNPNCGTLFSLTKPAAGSTVWRYNLLHQFQGKATLEDDGSDPEAAPLYVGTGSCPAPFLYGTTARGGPFGEGTVYQYDLTHGGIPKILYAFAGGSDGATPLTDLICSGGKLYGTTYAGGGSDACGAGGCGTIFQLTPPAQGQAQWIETVLYAFQGGSADGAGPRSALLQVTPHSLWGTTSAGGMGQTNCAPGPQYKLGGCGAVFSINPVNPSQYKLIYSFQGGATDGATPEGHLALGKNDVVYGTTAAGGAALCGATGQDQACGTIFAIDQTGRETLQPLSGQQGGQPIGGVTSLFSFHKGTLYIPGAGGAGSETDGTLLDVAPPTDGGGFGTPELLAGFAGKTGEVPAGFLLLLHGYLYGTTQQGGINKTGTVFEIHP